MLRKLCTAVLLLALLTPSLTYAQQEVLACGQSTTSSGGTMTVPLKTDSTGQMYSIPVHDPNASVTDGVSVRQTKVVYLRLIAGSSASACTVPGGSSCLVILPATEIIQWRSVSLTLINNAILAPLVNVLVEMSPDGLSWEVWDATTFANLAAFNPLNPDNANFKSIQLNGNSRRYIRVEARMDSTPVNGQTPFLSTDTYLTLGE